MIDVARRRHPGLDFRVGSITHLDVPDASWAGKVAVYSIIHLPPPTGSAPTGRFEREPVPDVEYRSRRSYLIGRRGIPSS